MTLKPVKLSAKTVNSGFLRILEKLFSYFSFLRLDLFKAQNLLLFRRLLLFVQVKFIRKIFLSIKQIFKLGLQITLWNSETLIRIFEE